MNKIILLLIFFILASCNPKSGVKINTSGIFKPFLYSIDSKNASGTILDYGEILLSDEPKILTIQIYNDSDYPYTDLSLTFKNIDNSFSIINFNPSSDGNVSFPGMDGTCTAILQPKKSCLIKVVMAPRDEKKYEEYIVLKFKNLVDVEEHKATLSFLAGWPASLVFTNDITNYSFGEQIGLPPIPVVEREDLVTFEENIIIKNAGGLSARNISFMENEICISTLINHCPAGMFGAYKIEHNCPNRLGPTESCDLKIKYLPKNQAPSSGSTLEEIKNINYKFNLSLKYFRDSKNSEGALNAYFNSWATNIQANFRSNVALLEIADPVISGNRDVKNFRIINNGFREGELKYITFKDSANTHLADCYAQDGTNVLRCLNSSQAELSLAEFPFTIKDLGQCLPSGLNDPKFVNVGNSCSFDIVFQPSNTYLVDKPLEFKNLQVHVTFDSRWRGAEKIEKSFLLDYSATSKSAARVVVESITFGGTNLSLSSSPVTVDLGRLALQSKSHTQKKPILITFKNLGSEAATAISFADGKGQNIVIGGSTNLGTGSYLYFTNTSASLSSCTTIAPQDSCTLTTYFAPIGLTEPEEMARMYDIIDEDDVYQSFKEFKISYHSGASFTDENRIDDVDYVTAPTVARFKARLIRKGLLMDLNNDDFNRNVINNITAGDESHYALRLRNIGTGNIPYIRLRNPPDSMSAFSILTTSDPTSFGADFDCANIVDSATPASTPLWPIPGGTSYGILPPDKSCIYTIKIQKRDHNKRVNILSCDFSTPNPMLESDLQRFFSRSVSSTDYWNFCNQNTDENRNFNYTYYDGDVIDPTYSMGTDFTLPSFNLTAQSRTKANIILSDFKPALTGTMYRPPVIYPAIPSAGLSSYTIPTTWFYGTGLQIDTRKDALAAVTALIQGDESRAVLPTTDAYLSKRSNYDYIYYVGSFPQELSTFIFPLPLKNTGNRNAVIKSATINQVMGSAFSYTGSYTNNFTAPGGANLPGPTFRFNPNAAPGEHQMEIIIKYTNGQNLAPLTFADSNEASNINTAPKQEIEFRLLVVGLIEDQYPSLSLSVEDYEVVQNVGAAPTETIQPPLSKSLTWNEINPTNTLTFDTIKLSTAPKLEDSYAKKRLTYTNNTLHTINDLRLIFRSRSIDSLPKANNPRFVMSGNCAQGMTLAPSQSCSVTLFYQPTSTDIADTSVLTAVFNMGDSKYLMQNIGIELFPRAPGALVAANKTTEVINYKSAPASSTITRSSYPMNIGENQIINSNPKTFEFVGANKVTVRNTQGTKASLLLAYQRNLAKNSLRGYNPSSTVPVSVVPDAGEYFTTEGGQYVVIHEILYSPNNPRVSIAANKACLFGDDELNASIPFHEKGFNNVTTSVCYLLFEFNANFSYINQKILAAEPLDMMNVASELWYYSVKRSSSASFWFHIRGSLLPDTSVINQGIADVQPLDNKKVYFTLPKMSPSYSDMGEIVGIRILMSNDKAKLNNPYDKTLSYKDFKPYNPDDPVLAEWATGLANSQFFFFRPVAIRKHTSFTDSVPTRFAGLSANEYLSATSASNVMETLVPPINHFYFHPLKILVDKNIANSSMFSYAAGLEICTKKTINITYNFSDSRARSYTLVNLAAWSAIANEPLASSYAEVFQKTHWLSEPAIDLDATIGHYTGFIPGTSSQFLDAHSVFYIRDSQNPSTLLRRAEGGVLNGVKTNWTSYLNPVSPLAVSRCMMTF